MRENPGVDNIWVRLPVIPGQMEMFNVDGTYFFHFANKVN